MITTGFLVILMALFSPVVDQLPTIDVSGMLSGAGADTFLEWVSLAGYMLPFETFYSIFRIIIALHVFRIVVSFFKNLWGVLPFVG